MRFSPFSAQNGFFSVLKTLWPYIMPVFTFITDFKCERQPERKTSAILGCVARVNASYLFRDTDHTLFGHRVDGTWCTSLIAVKENRLFSLNTPVPYTYHDKLLGLVYFIHKLSLRHPIRINCDGVW